MQVVRLLEYVGGGMGTISIATMADVPAEEHVRICFFWDTWIDTGLEFAGI
jgi:hypothetical protein